MYIHIGQDSVVTDDEIIGIFDMENTTVMKDTVNFLNKAEKKGEVKSVAPYELPKSFILCRKKGDEKRRIHISPVSVGTVLKRTEEKNYKGL